MVIYKLSEDWGSAWKKMSSRLIFLLEVKSEPCQAMSHEYICTGAWAFASRGYHWVQDNPFLSLRLLTNTHTLYRAHMHFWLPESCSRDKSTAVFGEVAEGERGVLGALISTKREWQSLADGTVGGKKATACVLTLTLQWSTEHSLTA